MNVLAVLSILTTLFVAVSCAAVHECTYDVATTPAALHVVSESVHSTYVPNSKTGFILFKCDAVGYGYVKLDCLEDGSWSAPDRDCGDEIPTKVPSVIGMVCAGITVVFVCVFIGLTKSEEKESSSAEAHKVSDDAKPDA